MRLYFSNTPPASPEVVCVTSGCPPGRDQCPLPAPVQPHWHPHGGLRHGAPRPHNHPADRDHRRQEKGGTDLPCHHVHFNHHLHHVQVEQNILANIMFSVGIGFALLIMGMEIDLDQVFKVVK